MAESAPTPEQRFRALCEVGKAISASLTREETLALICERSSRLLEAESAVITEYLPADSSEDEALQVIATSPGATIGLGQTLPVENSLNGFVFQTQTPVVCNDVPGDDRVDISAATKLNVLQAVVAPLIAGDEALGTLAVFNSTPASEFGDEDAEILAALADYAAIAIRNARLFEERDRRVRELRRARTDQDIILNRLHGLIRVGMALSSQLSLEEVLQTLVDSARETIGARYAALGVLDSSGARLSRFITSGVTSEMEAEIGQPPVGKGTLGIMLRDQRKIRIANLQEHSAFEGFPKGHPEMTSLLGVPVRIRDRVYGNLYLTDKIGAPEFSQEDEQLAELLAAQAAVAIDNARLSEQRTQLHAIVNHEIKNAAAGVLGWTERLRSLTRDAERRVREGADYAFEGAQNLHKLVVDLLDLSRLESRLLELELSEVDLRALVREAVAAVKPAADRREIEISMTGLESRAIALTDRARVRQILINLLSNAIKFSPEGETIDLQIDQDEEAFTLTVEDRGPGVDPAHRDTIFEIHARRREPGAGSGLGLAIARQLATALGGELHLVDGQAQEGACFRLSLPRQPRHEVRRPSAPRKSRVAPDRA